jgi:hypothetical protein
MGILLPPPDTGSFNPMRLLGQFSLSQAAASSRKSPVSIETSINIPLIRSLELTRCRLEMRLSGKPSTSFANAVTPERHWLQEG